MAVDEVEIHIFGGGARGESIAIRLGTSSNIWGVVDSFAPSLKSADDHPTISFLKSKGVTQLEFVALTHPHADHYRGMSLLLQEFKVSSFWQFDGVSPNQIAFIISLARGKSDEDANELHQILKIRKDKDIAPRTMAAGTKLYPLPKETSPFSIWSIAPSGSNKAKYEESLKTCFQNDDSFRQDRGNKLDHNLISSALVIEFANVRVVLGGDVEREGWETILHERGQDGLKAHVVKVPHHGSVTGYCEGLWHAFGTPPCVAVTTTFANKGLPNEVALLHISNFSSQIYTTSLAATPFTDEWREEVSEEVVADLPFEQEQLLRTTFSSLQPAKKYKPGRCSITIKSNGALTVSPSGAAAEIASKIASNRQ